MYTVYMIVPTGTARMRCFVIPTFHSKTATGGSKTLRSTVQSGPTVAFQATMYYSGMGISGLNIDLVRVILF